MMTEITLDLETLDKRAGGVILSIGAVARCGEEQGEFYCGIDLRDCLGLGMTVDAETHLWWMEQEPEVRKEAFSGEAMLEDALVDFEAWVKSVESPGNILIYGKGPSFDCVILGAAYDLMGWPRPWEFWQERCVRTVVTEAARVLSGDRRGSVPERDLHVVPRIPHHALWDARAEMETLLRVRERVAAKLMVPFQN